MQINKWQDHKTKNPVGEVTRVLGASGDNEAEIHSIMAEFDRGFEFLVNVTIAA